MRIVSYNMRKGGAGRVHWATVFEKFSADILLAQESYSPAEHLPPLLHGNAASSAVWQAVPGQKWGSAIFSRQGSIRKLELAGFPGNVVGAEVAGLPGNDHSTVRIFSIHAPQQGSYQKAVNAILDQIAGFRAGTEFVIGGDFNLTVGERHDTETMTTTAGELAIQRRLRDEFGLVNCWQTVNRGCPLPQTLRWSSDRGKDPFHCDGIFVPASWAPRLVDCSVIAGGDWDRMSDHNPVVATFK